MRYVQIFIYSITVSAALITGFKGIQSWRAMEDELDWGTAGKSPLQRMFRNVAKEYEARDRQLPRLHKRWSSWSILFGILLIIEVIAFQR
jgi:hypothetical protein